MAQTTSRPCPDANITTDSAAVGGVAFISNGGDSSRGRDFYAESARRGYRVVQNRTAMTSVANTNSKVLGIFA